MIERDSDYCERCYSYSHPYASACLGCGAPMHSILAAALAQEAARRAELANADHVPASIEELLARARPGTHDLVRSLWEVGTSIEDLWKLAGPIRLSRTPRKSMRSGWREDPGALFGKVRAMKLRYLGGLPWVPSPTDIAWVVGPAELVISSEAGGRGLVTIRGEDVLLAAPHAIDEALFNGTLAGLGIGYGTGHVTTFAWVNPRMNTAQLHIAFLDSGAINAVVIGNRTGLMAPRYKLESYAALATLIGLWASGLARDRVEEMGASAYAAQLGFAL